MSEHEDSKSLLRQLAEVTAECGELNALFDLQHKADMRAIKLWQEAHPEKKHTWPDRCNMVVWLLEQLAEVTEERELYRANILLHMEARNDALNQLFDLQRRIAESPVGHLVKTLHDSQSWTVLRGVKRPYTLTAVERVRLVSDPEPPESEEPPAC